MVFISRVRRAFCINLLPALLCYLSNRPVPTDAWRPPHATPIPRRYKCDHISCSFPHLRRHANPRPPPRSHSSNVRAQTQSVPRPRRSRVPTASRQPGAFLPRRSRAATSSVTGRTKSDAPITCDRSRRPLATPAGSVSRDSWAASRAVVSRKTGTLTESARKPALARASPVAAHRDRH